MQFRKNKLALILGTMTAVGVQAGNVYTFDEVIVSATKTTQLAEDVAASVDVVNAEEISKNLAQDLEQVVEKEPGVSMAGTGRFGSSGFTIRGLSENYVKTVVDGVELPASFDPGADQMRKFNNTLETDTLQRVEVNKGPSSTLYGSDALAGAVIIRTKNPADLLQSEGDEIYGDVKSGYYSANDSYKTTVTLANRSGDWESLLIATHRQGHETKTHDSGSDILGRDRGKANPLDFESNNLLGKVFYQINTNHRVGLTAEFFNQTAAGETLSNEGYTMMPTYTYTRNTTDDENNRKRLSLEHEWQTESIFFERAFWKLTGAESQSIYNNYDQTEAKGYRNRYRSGEDKSLQLDVQLDKAIDLLSSSHEITYGLNWVNNKFELDYRDITLEANADGSIPAGTVTDKGGEVPNARTEKWGLYIQDQAFLMEDALVLNAGLRYDNFSATPENDMTPSKSDAVTGKFGGVYHLNDTWSVVANISQGFKSPTLQDLYYFYSMGSIYEPNPNLQPEKSLGYETGVRFNTDLAQINLTGFYNDYKNLIQSVRLADDPDTGREVWTKENVAKAKIYGAEIKSTFDLDELISAPTGTYGKASLAYAQGENLVNGAALDSVAPLTGHLAVGYQDPTRTYGGEISLRMAQSKSGDDWSNQDGVNVEAPSYTVTDLTAFYQPQKNLTIRGGVFNAFDEKYWDYQDLAGSTSTDQGLDRKSQPGRNVGIELEYQF